MTEAPDTQAQGPAPAAWQAEFDRALAFHRRGQLADAERVCVELLQREPRQYDALHMLGVIFLQTRRLRRAAEAIAQAIALRPDANAYCNLASALIGLKRFDQALASCDKASALKPDFAAAHNNRCLALNGLSRFADALASCDTAIALKPDYAQAHSNRALVLNNLKCYAEALASCDRALALMPDFPEALNNRAVALIGLGRHAEALAHCDRAIALNPNFAEIHRSRGNALTGLSRNAEALESYRAALARKPDSEFLFGTCMNTRMLMCDWRNLEHVTAQLVERARRGERVLSPFVALSISDSLSLQRCASEIWAEAARPANTPLAAIPARPAHDKIRIGYFSGDFRTHPVAIAAVELFERHDRTRFEVTAYSFGETTSDDNGRRLAAAFDKFIDVRNQPDQNIAALAREHELDIAVDLMGHTRESRVGIFLLRAAPVQVSFLGFAGTMAAPSIDYLIADPVVIPESRREHYAEKIAYLPNTYMPHDSRQAISDRAFARAEFGLPPSGAVFCCFNNSYKINPAIFDSWARILKKVPGSVLWLSADETAATNLRREAENRGIDPNRLVFAAKTQLLADHLARLRLADLFLDTLPFNAHTTANDALWAGVPVLTRMGETFAGRVAASLLTAIGLPELIASTPQAYEDLAAELAGNPEKLAAIRHRLADSRLATPLFDTPLFTRHIEAAYTAMHERRLTGLPPDHIFIAN